MLSKVTRGSIALTAKGSKSVLSFASTRSTGLEKDHTGTKFCFEKKIFYAVHDYPYGSYLSFYLEIKTRICAFQRRDKLKLPTKQYEMTPDPVFMRVEPQHSGRQV